MTHHLHRLAVASVCALACATAAAALLRGPSVDIRTEDRNGDGRPDVWRTYDRQARLSEVAVDSNFDGRSDVHEYYDAGALVRRESDRNFNNRIDLVQEFDAKTRERVRSFEDVDFDGSADILVLFQHDRPVFQKWARPLATAAGWGVPTSRDIARRAADRELIPLGDPFRGDLALRTLLFAGNAGSSAGLTTSGGLPAASRSALGPVSASSSLDGCGTPHSPSASAAPYAPRGPPLSSLS